MMARSEGHLGWSRDGSWEYWEHNGEVYRAPVGNAFDVRTGRRLGRWECSKKMWDRYFDTVFTQYVVLS
jgi:hypothetical protein